VRSLSVSLGLSLLLWDLVRLKNDIKWRRREDLSFHMLISSSSLVPFAVTERERKREGERRISCFCQRNFP